MRELRLALGLTHEQIVEITAKDPSIRLGRIELSHVEHGRNKVTSARMRKGLATAFRLTGEEFEALLAGRLSLDEAVRLSKARAGGRSVHAIAAPERWVELEPRYPNFVSAAKTLLVAGRIDEETAQEEGQIAMHREADFDEATWISVLLDAHRKRGFGRRAPAEAKRLEEQGAAQADEEDVPPIGKMLEDQSKAGREDP